MSSREARRTLNDLEKISEGKVLTKDGKNWLIQATDPFHDTTVESTGYPDCDIAGSVVQVVKKSATFQCPAEITTGTWDAHIVQWPVVNNNIGQKVTLKHSNFITTTSSPVATPYNIGGFTGMAGPSGQGLYGSSSICYPVVNIGLDPKFTEGTARVVGMGYEIINSTADIYKQGMCTVYRQPTPNINRRATYTYGTDATNLVRQGDFSAYVLPQPPSVLSEAVMLSGSKQWAAEEGCYNVATMNSLDNPPHQPEPIAILSVESENTVNYVGNAAAVISNINSVSVGTGTHYAPFSCHLAPFNMSGAYFTGLSLQTTLTLNVIFYVERFPTPFDTDLVVMAKPSPFYDPVAQELYCKAMCSMPAGVMVKENPFGEWFRDVVHNIAQHSGPVLSALSVVHPGFGLAAGAAKIVEDLTETKREAKREAQKASKPVPRANVPAQKQIGAGLRQSRARQPIPQTPRVKRRKAGV